MAWIKEIVTTLVNKYGTNNPYEIAERQNINVIQWDLHHEIKGFYKYNRRNKFIFINNNLDEKMQKFVCAHELGHSQLHPTVNTPFMRANTFLSVDRIEIEANRFATELLLPDDTVLQYRHTDLSLKEICEAHDIPGELYHYKKIE